jgi:ELWxxDGT repeat protein
VVGNTLYFAAEDGQGGRELWKSDGTSAGTVRVKDISPGAVGSSPVGLMAVGNTLYFTADDGTSGAELWKSNGTDAGTVRASVMAVARTPVLCRRDAVSQYPPGYGRRRPANWGKPPPGGLARAAHGDGLRRTGGEVCETVNRASVVMKKPGLPKRRPGFFIIARIRRDAASGKAGNQTKQGYCLKTFKVPTTRFWSSTSEKK